MCVGGGGRLKGVLEEKLPMQILFSHAAEVIIPWQGCFLLVEMHYQGAC